jgi:hypothetical protein
VSRHSLWLPYGVYTHLLQEWSHPASHPRVRVLSSGRADTERLDRLVDELRSASIPRPYLIVRVVADACTRLPNLARTDKIARLDRLVRAEAWTDAALSIIELELPMWRPRRLVYDDGEWLCSLSRHPEVPIELDETADGQHEMQPVAILLSFVEAKRLLTAIELAGAPSVPQVGTSLLLRQLPVKRMHARELAVTNSDLRRALAKGHLKI